MWLVVAAPAGADGQAVLRRRELGHGLGALGHGVLGELAREDEAHGRLDLARRERRLAREAAELGRLAGDACVWGVFLDARRGRRKK